MFADQIKENKIQIWCRRAGPNYLEAPIQIGRARHLDAHWIIPGRFLSVRRASRN